MVVQLAFMHTFTLLFALAQLWCGHDPMGPSTTGVSGTCLGIILTTSDHVARLFTATRSVANPTGIDRPEGVIA